MISKKLLFLVFCLPFLAHAQSFTPDRSSSSITVQDARWRARLTMYLPHTHGLTLNGGLDTLGAMLYEDSSGHVWYRDTVIGVGHKWTMLVTGAPPVNNGLYDSSGTLQLGEPYNKAGNPARLYGNREIPLNGNRFTFWDTANNSSGSRFVHNDTAHSNALGTSYKVQVRQFADSPAGVANWNAWLPSNYKTLYPNARPNGQPMKAMGWGWGYSENFSGGLPAPDNVFGGGYNMVNATNRADTNDAALSMRLETNFAVLDAFGAFEMHWPELITFRRGPFRVNSFYMGKDNPNVLWENNIDDHQIKSTGTLCTGCVYYELSSNGGQFPQIKLAGAFTHSLDGDFLFLDAAGSYYMLRALDGDLFLSGSASGPSNVFYNVGNVNFNFNAGVGENVGRTWIGTPPGNISAYNSAQFAIFAHDRGMLPPGMTTTEKNAISSAAEGLVVHDSTLQQNAEYTTKWINRGDIIFNHIIFTPTDAGTVTLTNNVYNIVNPSGSLTTLTVNLPSSPVNNDVVIIKYTKAVATVTYANGTVADGITAPTAGAMVTLTYDAGATTWY